MLTGKLKIQKKVNSKHCFQEIACRITQAKTGKGN
uniref:Uncharacterized protein n=1 Tax=Rhizophora mucronata TaxID=61149 RepID=A0A2P2NSH8_RHIMU